MGRIGAGKSTLVKLLARLLDPPAQRIRLDGHPIEDYPLAELRRQVAVVLQEAFLFAEPIRENLSYDDPARPEPSVWAAADLADLATTVATLPERLETLVGERGVTLSGGQRQRATLARGLIRDAPVLVLDDCFSSVDTDTEERILRALLHARAGRTTLLVTHRVSTARQADRVVVLDAGRVTESGSHAELVTGAGYYARLAREQAPAPQEAAPAGGGGS